MIFYVLNRQEELLTILSNEGSENSILYKAIVREQLDKMYTLELEISAITPEAQYLSEENYVLFEDLLGDWQLYVIKQVDETHGVDHTKSIYCESASQELIDELYITEIKGSVTSPVTALTSALGGTRWEVGTVSSVAAHELTTLSLNKTVLEVIQGLRSEYALHIKFRYTVVGNQITHRYVDLLTDIGHDYGKRFEYSKDIETITRLVDTTDIKTAVVPLGGIPEGGTEAININSVVWATPTDPLNKPNGQSYLEDIAATTMWGFGTTVKRPRFIYYENSEAVDSNALILGAYAVLKAMSIPKVTYTLKVVDLYAMSNDSEMSFESVQTGDLSIVVDTEFIPAIAVKTTIIERVVDLLMPENNEVILGNYVNSLADASTSAIISIVNDKLGAFKPPTNITVFGNGNYSEIEKVNDQDFKESIGYTYLKDTEGLWVYDSPSDVAPTKMIAIKGGKLGVGKWNAQTMQWDITTFIDGDSVNASAINTGFLSADRIEGGSLLIGHFETDVQDTLSSVIDKADLTYVDSQLSVREGDISLLIESNTAINDTLAEHETKLGLVDGKISFAISDIQTAVDDNGTSITQMTNYMEFTTDGLVLGKTGSETDYLKVKITNEDLEFLDHGTPVASISGQQMNIDKAIIGTSIVVGNHLIQKYDANITLVRWIG